MEKGNKGLIFNIVHSSFVDGPGIRTTIFLKGCPLRCIWCCNPEGQKFTPELKVAIEACNGCGRCLDACSRGALTLKNGKIDVERSLCDGCAECCGKCYMEALDVFGTWMTAEEVFADVVKDRIYYNKTGGGLTIGGGEATTYPEFCLELVELCHQEGFHVAVDTCGYVTSKRGMDVLMAADLLLFDIKGLDTQRHQTNTGVSNELILSNLRTLDAAGKNYYIRMPIIPGYNDSEDELSAAAELLTSLRGLKRLDILPVHEYGKSKYQELGMEYKLHCKVIPDERQKKILMFFQERGLPTQIGG
ncbi:MAG: glycyl-radical enzyme activating protein [Oscillospiraceae bacterium]|nr:glycyl-radical enzyme activating protein [Oscillospiraceae bacterium]